jgi:hypothetical protein
MDEEEESTMQPFEIETKKGDGSADEGVKSAGIDEGVERIVPGRRQRRFVHVGREVVDPKKEKERKKKLVRKIRMCTKAVSVLTVIALLLEVINRVFFSGSIPALSFGLATCFILGTAVFVFMLYGNLSFAVLCKLAKEPNVIFIISLGLFNLIIECVVPDDNMSVFLASTYLLNGTYFILFDAMEQKSRKMSIVVGLLFLTITIYNVCSISFLPSRAETVFFEYGANIKLYKVPLKRSVYVQILTYSCHAIYCLLTDKKMKKLMFVTSNVFRQEVIADKKVTTDDSVKFLDINLKELKEDVEGRSSILGNMKRWKIGSMFFCIFCFFMFSFYTFYNAGIREPWVVGGIWASGVLVLFSYFYGVLFKNAHWAIVKLLLKEVNVIAILLVTIMLLVVDFARPASPTSAVLSVFYVGCTWIFLSFDLLAQKDRKFVLFVGALYIFTTIYEIIDFTFLDADKDIVLLEYSNGLRFYKRSVSRTIFAHLFGLSFKALVTMLKDKKGQVLLFVTDNVYRMSGETSMDLSRARLSYLGKRQSEGLKRAEKSWVIKAVDRTNS